MGASGWSYFVPYQEDIAQALSDLRQRVFETGGYSTCGLLEGFDYFLDEVYPRATLSEAERTRMISAYAHGETIHLKEIRFDPPGSPDELVERCCPAHTRSVIDMRHVVAHPDFCAVAPFPDMVLRDLFDTDHPTKAQVLRLLNRRKRIDRFSEGDGIYIIVYDEQDQPSELFFQGKPGWHYFVPYQADIEHALQELRQHAFEKGEYVKKPLKERFGFVLAWLDHPEKLTQAERVRLLSICHTEPIDIEEAWIRPPQSADDVARRCGPSGTHSVIDIATLSPFPQGGAFSPLWQEDLLACFGTEQPTRAMIEHLCECCGMCHPKPRGEGTYIIVYKDGRPDEMYFEGSSGD